MTVTKEELMAKQKDLQARLDWLIGRSLAVWNYSDNPLAIVTEPDKTIDLQVRMNYNLNPIKDPTDPYLPFPLKTQYIGSADEVGFLLLTGLLNFTTTSSEMQQTIGMFAGRQENGKLTVEPKEVLKSYGLIFFIARQMLLDDTFRKYTMNGKIVTIAPDDTIDLITTPCDDKKKLSMLHDRLLFQAYFMPNFTKNAKYPAPVSVGEDDNEKADIAQLEMMMTQYLPYSKACLHVFGALFVGVSKMLGLSDADIDKWIQAGFSQTDDDGLRTFDPDLYYKMVTIWHGLVQYSLPHEIKKNFF